MPKKNTTGEFQKDIAEILKFMQQHIDERFDRVDGRFGQIDQQFRESIKRLDRIEFLLAGQERRIATLEDRMRIVATKLGLEFRPNA
jgi:ABC-type nitrate/sulfonate/bicarbonate transport system substrate-binding protein